MSETTAENRRQILEMVAAGKITAEEAERLMAAMEKPEAAKGPEAAWPASGGATARWDRHDRGSGPGAAEVHAHCGEC